MVDGDRNITQSYPLYLTQSYPLYLTLPSLSNPALTMPCPALSEPCPNHAQDPRYLALFHEYLEARKQAEIQVSLAC